MLYLFAGASFFFLVYAAFTNIINDFKSLKMYLPLFLTYLVPVVSLITAGLNDKIHGTKLKKTLFVFGIILTAFSSFTLIYTIFDIIFFLDGKIIYKSITSLFPLDMIVYNILYLVIGIMLIVSSKRAIEEHDIADVPHHKIIFKIFGSFFVVLTTYFAGLLLFAPIMADYSFKHIGGMIPIFLLMIVPVAELIVYWFIYPLIKMENKKRFVFHHSMYFISITLVLTIWVLLYELFNNSFIVEGNQAFFPITFAMSFPLGPVVIFLLCIIPPIVSLIILFFKNKKPKEQ